MLDTEQLISHTTTTLIDTVSSLQSFDGGLIGDLEVCELLRKIHDILGSVIAKWVGNTAHTLVYL